MKKRRVLKGIAKAKRLINKIIVYFFSKPAPKENVLLSNERQILKLLFTSELNDLKTEDSIELYKSVSEKFIKELDKRERRARAELTAIFAFTSEDNSFEQGKVKNLEFQKV